MTNKIENKSEEKIWVFKNNQDDLVIDSSQQPEKTAIAITRDEFRLLQKQDKPKI